MLRQIVFGYDDVEELWSHVVLPGFAVTNRGPLFASTDAPDADHRDAIDPGYEDATAGRGIQLDTGDLIDALFASL